MSQPPKSIIRAPSARWLACSGVVRGVNAECLSAQWSGRTGRKHTCVVRGGPGRIRAVAGRAASDSMRRPATLIGLVLATTLTAPAAAHAATAPPLLFPVVGGASYIDDYGAPRPQGRHEGNDLMAAKRTPGDRGRRRRRQLQHSGPRRVHAVPAQREARVALHPPEQRHPRQRRQGRQADGVRPRPALRACASRPGQEIAYVGNSGDAEGGPAHLHFEEHSRSGRPHDPYRHLRAAPDRAVLRAGHRGQGGVAGRADVARPPDVDRRRRRRPATCARPSA